MSYLIFCSFEVGGLPFRFAEILNRNNVETYYISLCSGNATHDSARFHYGAAKRPAWDLSASLDATPRLASILARRLKELCDGHGITKCFATGSRAFLLSDAGIPYIYWSYGADVDTLYFKRAYPVNSPLFKRFVHFCSVRLGFSRRMRQTLQAAGKIMIAPYQREGLDKLQLKKELFFLPHAFAVSSDYAALKEEKARSRAAVCRELRTDHFFFSSVRHVWAHENAQLSDHKGNDVAIRAFSLYMTKGRRGTCKLLLINKGYDLSSSRKLIQELGVTDAVVWKDQVPRHDLADYYRGARLCFGQFGTPVLTGAALEPLSFATPCVSYYGEEKTGIPYYTAYPPVYNCRDPQEIADFMSKLDEDDAFAESTRFSSWEWVRRHCSEKAFVESFKRAFE